IYASNPPARQGCCGKPESIQPDRIGWAGGGPACTLGPARQHLTNGLARREKPNGPSAVDERCQFTPDATGTPQMPSAYSQIVLSDENQPTFAVFSTLDRHQALRSRHRATTSRCAAR